MIPKIIHYCWFGGNPLTVDAKRYIDTWRKFCPDYEIIEWNDDNFNFSDNNYCREAYEAGKWAFVTDYVRLKVLYEYGGIYMDTDVEVCKNLDPLLKYNAFSGYESDSSILTGTIGACRGNEWIGMLLHDYDNRHFILADGSYDITTNVSTITRLTIERYNLVLDGKKKIFGDNILLLPFEYLCAKSIRAGIKKTNDTYTIHHFAGSWLSQKEKKRNDIYRKFYTECPVQIEEIAANYARIRTILKCDTYRDIINKIKNKL